MMGVALLAVRESIGLWNAQAESNVWCQRSSHLFLDYERCLCCYVLVLCCDYYRVISWSTCWDFFVPDRGCQATNLITAVILTVLITGVLMSYIVIFFAIKKYNVSSTVSLVGIN